MVNFWSDRSHIPMSADIALEDLRVITATYERHPSYKEPHLHLACWLYPSQEIGESMQCFYNPSIRLQPSH